MGRNLSVPLVFLILELTVTAAGAQRLVEVRLDRPEQVNELVRRDLDIWEADERDALVYVTEEQLAELEKSGFFLTDKSSQLKPTSLLRDVDGYLTLAEYEASMMSWAAAHSDIVSLATIGLSWEGRNIWLLKISDNVAVNEDEPEIVMISLQHAREWLAGMTLYGITDHLISQYGSDSTVTSLVDSMEIFVILVYNPDGYLYSHTTDRYWRHNRRGPTGVDLNRNFSWQWSGGGSAPFSEPETVAFRDWVLSRGKDLVGCLNYHTYATRVMHNWAYTYDLPPNVDVMGPVARQMADAIESVNGQRMRNGSWAITLEYLGGGTTIDYLHAELGIPTLTLEMRPGDNDGGGFAPSGAAIAPSQSENIAGAISFLNWVRPLAEDATPPVISGFEAAQVSDTWVKFTWTTDEPATGGVEYGLTLVYGATEELHRLRDQNHSLTLSGLSPGTTHQARVYSENLAGLIGYSTNVSFTTAGTPQDFTPPTYPAITRLCHSGAGLVDLEWVDLAASGVQGFRLYESTDGENWDLRLDEGDLPAGITSTTLSGVPVGQIQHYRMTTVDNSSHRNESIPSDTYAILMSDSQTRILIVDGYDRWNSKPVAQNGNHAFAADHGVAIAAYGAPFDSCANQSVGDTVNLLDYEIVVWVLGDESTSNETFSSFEQDRVKEFLEAGGKLFVSGSEIAWDLDRSSGPTAEDRAFFNYYLCADYVKDDIDNYDVSGSGGSSLFGTDLVRFDEGSRGIYRVSTPDGVLPMNGGIAALESPSGEVCAVQREGIFGSGLAPASLVYLAIPFETIFPAEGRAEVMADILEYFGAESPLPVGGWQVY